MDRKNARGGTILDTPNIVEPDDEVGSRHVVDHVVNVEAAELLPPQPLVDPKQRPVVDGPVPQLTARALQLVPPRTPREGRLVEKLLDHRARRNRPLISAAGRLLGSKLLSRNVWIDTDACPLGMADQLPQVRQVTA